MTDPVLKYSFYLLKFFQIDRQITFIITKFVCTRSILQCELALGQQFSACHYLIVRIGQLSLLLGFY